MSTSTDHFAPCGYTLILDWVPTVRSYQDRLLPLGRLEDRGLLKAFQVHDNHVGARLETVELQIWAHGMSIVTSGKLSSPICVELVENVIDAIQPRSFRRFEILQQYLVPLSVSYDAARALGLEALRTARLAEIGAIDFAYMITGESPDINWVLQAGIVSTEEIRPRIMRDNGLFRHLPSSTVILDALKLPEVAFFCDSEWTVNNLHPTIEPKEWVPEVVAEAERLASDILPHAVRGIVGEIAESNGGNDS